MGDSQSLMGVDPAVAQNSVNGANAGQMPGGQASDALTNLMKNPSAAAAWAASANRDGNNRGDGTPDTGLLAQLVILLGQRPRNSLLLSDLGALLPSQLRAGVKERGGLRSWLQRYPELFTVTGAPGKESVTLMLGANSEAAAGDSVEAHNETPEVTTVQGGAGAATQEDDGNDSALQLRGLPYKATVSDLRKFLGDHVRNLRDDQSVQLVLNRDGRPSGFARVQFNSPQAALEAKDALHNRFMEVAGMPKTDDKNGNRYVEVFLYSERPNKLRFKKNITSDGQIPAAGEVTQEDLDALGVSKEDVIEQCRIHMRQPGQNKLLLSMLGVALSDPARAYLKKTDQGLKHFLAQYPSEFSVDGQKGREMITFLPATPAHEMPPRVHPPTKDPLPMQSPGARGAGAGLPATPFMYDIQTPTWTPGTRRHAPPAVRRPEETGYIGSNNPKDSWMPPQSPKTNRKHDFGHDQGQKTPSTWGTPTTDRIQDQMYRDMVTKDAVQSHEVLQLCQAFRMSAGAAVSSDAAQLPYQNWAAWGFPPSAAGGGAGMPSNFMELLMQQQQQQMMLQAASQAASEQMRSQQQKPPQPQTKVAPPAATPDIGGSGVPPAEILLRGLPLHSSEQDVFAFFGKFDIVDLIAETKDAVRLLPKGNGKPSGQAIVQMMSRADAMDVVKVLNGQYMGDRYIEAFLNPQRAPAAPATSAATTPATSAAPSAPGAPTSGDGGDTGGSGNLTPAALMRMAAQSGVMPFMPFNMGPGMPPGSQMPGAFPVGLPMPPPPPDTQGKDSTAAWDTLFGYLRHEQMSGGAGAAGSRPGGSLETL